MVYKLLFVDYLPNDGSHHFLTALTSVFEAGFVTFAPSFKRFNVSSQISLVTSHDLHHHHDQGKVGTKVTTQQNNDAIRCICFLTAKFWWRESSETVLGFLSRNLSPKVKDLPTNHVPDDSKCALHKINSAYFAHHVLFRLIVLY